MIRENEQLTFLSEALKDKTVASIIPTFSHTAHKICSLVDLSSGPKVIVEYGAGTGVFTKCLLEQAQPGSNVIAIEQNNRFVSMLNKLPVKDSIQYKVVDDSALNIQTVLSDEHIEQVDCVISGIPLSMLSLKDKRKIIQYTHDILKPGGSFLIYQVSFHAEKFVREKFANVSKEWFFLAIPPLAVLLAQKPRLN